MSAGKPSVGHHESRPGVDPNQGRRRPRWAVGAAALLALCASAVPVAPAFGEGSVDFNPGADSVFRNGLAQSLTSYTVLRVYARAGEKLQMGNFMIGRSTSGFPAPTTSRANIRVYPPGTGFASSTDPSRSATLSEPASSAPIFSCTSDAPGTGQIADRAQELAGPAPNPGGYTPCEFTVPADGIYPIVMTPYFVGPPLRSAGTIGSPQWSNNSSTIAAWDVTVRDAGGVVQPGRLFVHRAHFYELSTSSANGPSPVAYLYTPAGYVYRVRMFSHRGQDWVLAADDKGVVNASTGERLFASFQWGNSDVTGENTVVHTEAIAPLLSAPDLANDSRFPIFFREPDPAAIAGLGAERGYATAPIAPSSALSGLSFTGTGGVAGATSQGEGGTIAFNAPTQLAGLGYTVEIDTNANGSFGDAADFVDDTADLASSGANSYSWNGLAGDGSVPGCGSYAYRVRSTLAEIHLTQSDVEQSGGTLIERLSLPTDPALGDPFAASYNDVDPYKGTAVTDASPVERDPGTSSPTFHAWTGTATTGTGNADFVDTWMRLPEVAATGTLQVCLPPPPSPSEVSVDKRASDGRVVVGDTVTYRLVAKNNSAGHADGVVVEDRVPSKLDVRGASSTQGDCMVSGNQVRCEIGALASGAEATVTVRSVAVEAGQSTNRGIVIADRCPAEGCDTDPAPVKIVKPKLRVSKTAAKARVRAGNTLTYSIRVTNPSKAAVRDVRTCDLMPAGLVPVSATPKVKVSKGRYCWTAKRLGAGKSKTYEITVRALPGAAGRTINRATASSGAVRGTARAARAVKVLPRQATREGGVTG